MQIFLVIETVDFELNFLAALVVKHTGWFCRFQTNSQNVSIAWNFYYFFDIVLLNKFTMLSFPVFLCCLLIMFSSCMNFLFCLR